MQKKKCINGFFKTAHDNYSLTLLMLVGSV